MSKKKRIDKLENIVIELRREIEELKELQKCTVSQRTLEKDPPPTASQVLDEWLNGKESDDGN